MSRKRKRVSMKKHSQAKGIHRTRLLIGIIFFLTVLSCGIYFYQNRPFFSSYVQHTTRWMAGKKPQLFLDQRQSENERLTHAEHEVQFKFYSALPAIPVNAVPKEVKINNVAIRTDELEHELATHLKQINHDDYIIVLGIFDNEKSATMQRNQIISFSQKSSDKKINTSLSVLKIHSGKKVFYRVQQGPFSYNVAKRTQQKWQMNGINVSIKKMEI